MRLICSSYRLVAGRTSRARLHDGTPVGRLVAAFKRLLHGIEELLSDITLDSGYYPRNGNGVGGGRGGSAFNSSQGGVGSGSRGLGRGGGHGGGEAPGEESNDELGRSMSAQLTF